MIEIPKHLRARPTYGGFVVPYFVSWFIGDKMVDEREPGAKPDFRVVDLRRAAICRQRGICWICGKQLGSHLWFSFGPSSALGRTALEPPAHRDCAHYAAQVCPYMLNPNARHRGKDNLSKYEVIMPVDDYHPGVVVLWATKSYELVPIDPPRGVFYYKPGDPDVVEFWQQGRKATRAEIDKSVDLALIANKVDRNNREVAWDIEQLMRWAPEP